MTRCSLPLGLLILTSLVLVAIFAPVIAPYDPDQSMLDLGIPGRRGEPPCIHLLGCPADRVEHIMGLDSNLRDEFSRIVYGARVSLQVGFLTVGLAIIIGSAIGALAGFFGGATDNLLMRVMDVLLSFPSLILAIAIVTVAAVMPAITVVIAAGRVVSTVVRGRRHRASGTIDDLVQFTSVQPHATALRAVVDLYA